MNTINRDLYKIISSNKSIVYKSQNSKDSNIFSDISKKNIKASSNNLLTIRDLLKDTSKNVIEKHMLKMNSSMIRIYNINNLFNSFSLMDVAIKKYNSHLKIKNQDSKINTKETDSSIELIKDENLIENSKVIGKNKIKKEPLVKDLILKNTNVLTDQKNINLLDQKSDIELLNNTKEFNASLVIDLLANININKKFKLPSIYIYNKNNHSIFDLSI